MAQQHSVNVASGPRVGQRDERTAIALGQDAHELGIATRGIRRLATRVEEEWKTNGVNPHHAVAVFILAIDGINLAHHGFNRAAAELVAKYIDADLLFGRPVGADRVNDAVGGVTVTERPPVRIVLRSLRAGPAYPESTGPHTA